MVEFLVAHGANVNQADIDGETPLLKAASSGHLDAVSFLVVHGADVNHADSYGETPLSVARNETIRDYLLAHGARFKPPQQP